MNPVALFFASGDSLYAGSVLLLLSVAIPPTVKRRSVLQVRNVIAWLALLAMVMACPPFAWTVDVIFVGVFILWYLAANWAERHYLAARWRAATATVLVLLAVGLSASELRHRAMPRITAAAGDHLVVIGDSISAGLGGSGQAWTVVFQKMTGVPVKNLAQPGARAIDGLAMAEKLTAEDRMVVIELGGNDLLDDAPSAQFARDMENLVAKVVAPGRTVLMFELPLLPHKIGFGRVQRRVAAEHGIFLIPKHCFTAVLSGADATSDGLHLSKPGAEHMAALMAKVVSPVLKSRITSAKT